MTISSKRGILVAYFCCFHLYSAEANKFKQGYHFQVMPHFYFSQYIYIRCIFRMKDWQIVRLLRSDMAARSKFEILKGKNFTKNRF